MIRKAAMLLLGMALVVSTVYADPVRVTGGGSIGTGANHVSIALSLSCDPTQGPNNLVLNLNRGLTGEKEHFELDTVTSATCSTDASGVDTLVGSGTGTLNGVSGVEVTYIITEASKGGIPDVTVGGALFEVAGNLPGIQFHS